MRNELAQKAIDKKKCSVCHAEKALEEFYPRRQKRRGYQSECRVCCRLRRSKWWKSPAGKLSSAQTKLRSRFGITLSQYETLLKIQNGRCAVCGSSESYLGHKLAVDHDHRTKQVRGLLCKACNLGIGNFMDDPDRLKAAIFYLEKVKGAEGNR